MGKLLAHMWCFLTSQGAHDFHYDLSECASQGLVRLKCANCGKTTPGFAAGAFTHSSVVKS